MKLTNRKPNFYVIGAQKAGTTSLHNYLSCHPEIYLPARKESKYFVMDRRYAKGFSHYLDENYAAVAGQKMIGEVDPDYMYFECAIERMTHHFDLRDLKLVIVLRNPADRAFSHYLMTYRRGLETLSFEDAISCEDERLSKSIGEDKIFHNRMHYSYIDRGFYYKQVSRLLDYIDFENLHFVLSDDLKNKPRESLAQIYNFLDVDKSFENSKVETHHHRATAPRNVQMIKWLNNKNSPLKNVLKTLFPSEAIRARLREYLLHKNLSDARVPTLRSDTRDILQDLYCDDIASLGRLTGLNFERWA
ncbi:MAG: sulfotransferase [Halioglobus sp.]